MPTRFDQLASDLIALRTLLGIEKGRRGGKLAALRSALECHFMKPVLRAGSALFADERNMRTWWPRLLRAMAAALGVFWAKIRKIGIEIAGRAQLWNPALPRHARFESKISKRNRPAGLRESSDVPHLGPEKRLAASKWTKEMRILTVIVFVAVGAFSLSAAIFVQFRALQAEVVSLKRHLAGTTEKLAKLEANVVAARPDPTDINEGADRRKLASASGMPQASFTLTQDEVKLIRDFIKVPPAPPGAARNINIGDLLSDTALAPLPEPIMKKAPKLLDARFTVDRNGTIVVVAPGTNRAEVLINPN
jgi:hypothetical protein